MKIINGDIYQKEYKRDKKYNYYKELSKNILLLIIGITMLISDFFIHIGSYLISFIIFIYIANSMIEIIKYKEDFYLGKIVKLTLLALLGLYIFINPKIPFELIFTFIGLSLLLEIIFQSLFYKYLNISKLILAIILLMAPLFIVKFFIYIIGFLLIFYSLNNLTKIIKKDV